MLLLELLGSGRYSRKSFNICALDYILTTITDMKPPTPLVPFMTATQPRVLPHRVHHPAVQYPLLVATLPVNTSCPLSPAAVFPTSRRVQLAISALALVAIVFGTLA